MTNLGSRRIRTVLASLVVSAMAVLPASAGSAEALMKEVEAVGDAIAKAMLEKDTDAMLSFYVEDAISLPNYSPRMDGIEAFRAHHAEMDAAGLKIHTFSSTPTDVWECGDQVVEIGSFEISLTMPGMPGPIEDQGKYMTIYVRDGDGALKIKAETWNSDVNPMMMGQ